MAVSRQSRWKESKIAFTWPFNIDFDEFNCRVTLKCFFISFAFSSKRYFRHFIMSRQTIQFVRISDHFGSHLLQDEASTLLLSWQRLALLMTLFGHNFNEIWSPRFCNYFSVIQIHYTTKIFSYFPGIKLELALQR